LPGAGWQERVTAMIKILKSVLLIVMFYCLFEVYYPDFGKSQGREKYIGWASSISYIDSINGTPREVELLRKYIKEFNNLSDKHDLIQYNSKETGIARTITISFSAPSEEYAGRAYSLFSRCYIFINQDFSGVAFSDETLKRIVLHEIMHCYGYDHTPHPDSFMYFVDNNYDVEKSYTLYAIDILRNRR